MWVELAINWFFGSLCAKRPSAVCTPFLSYIDRQKVLRKKLPLPPSPTMPKSPMINVNIPITETCLGTY
jgi:hypothetical protein